MTLKRSLRCGTWERSTSLGAGLHRPSTLTDTRPPCFEVEKRALGLGASAHYPPTNLGPSPLRTGSLSTMWTPRCQARVRKAGGRHWGWGTDIVWRKMSNDVEPPIETVAAPDAASTSFRCCGPQAPFVVSAFRTPYHSDRGCGTHPHLRFFFSKKKPWIFFSFFIFIFFNFSKIFYKKKWDNSSSNCRISCAKLLFFFWS